MSNLDSDRDIQTTALRYAARDLSPADQDAFEQQLATNQAARDALAEVVRLSAQAIGQEPPRPRAACRASLRARLNWLAYRGHPLHRVGFAAAVVAAFAVIIVSLTETVEPRRNTAWPATHTRELAPEPREKPFADNLADTRDGHSFAVHEAPPASQCEDESRSIAEIWADLSTPEHVERTRDEEIRWRLKMQNLMPPNHVVSPTKIDSPQP